MKRMMKIATLLFASLFIATACDKETNGSGTMSVRMKDQPIAFQEVNVEIRRVAVQYDDENAKRGWINLRTKSGVYDLLQLQNGVSTVLVEEDRMPAGHVSQMRLYLGTNNSVKISDVTYPLLLSSQDESGLKLNIDAQVRRNEHVEIYFDFDAQQSIIVQGTGEYKLKPVLHAVSVTYD
jgi:hypothetical protein